MQPRIIQMLQQKHLKPGELADRLGISRQALHRHLQELVKNKLIVKHGSGPHVTYSAVTSDMAESRIRNDYLFCTTKLLPQYIHDYAHPLERFHQQLRIQRSPVNADFSYLIDSAAVYSSNIEGNTLDLNSFLNSRMSPKKHRPKEAQEIEDLVSAYGYAKQHALNEKNMLHAHAILSHQFVAATRQGTYRQEPVGVFSRRGLEYMAVEPAFVSQEIKELFAIVMQLLRRKQPVADCFFWAAWLHLMIALIHPFSDGNGRTARLCEKWFLAAMLGTPSFAIPSEEQYWKHRPEYYAALKLGANYWETEMSKAFAFFALLPEVLGKKRSSPKRAWRGKKK